MSEISMRVTGAELTVNLYDLIASLAKEHRAEIIDALACQDDVIDEVVNQVLDGITTLCSCAGTNGGGNPDATRGIDGARMRIAKMAGEVADREIAALSRAVNRERARADAAWAEYHKVLDSRRGVFG